MKKIIIVLKFCLILSISIQSQIPTEGLIAHYPFDGSPEDITINNNNGNITGNVIGIDDRFGNTNGAFFFDGESGFIDIENDEILNLTQEITISIWIKPESIEDGGFTALVNKWQDIPWPEGGTGYFLGINPDGIKIRWNTGSIYADGNSIPTNEWTHLAVTYNNDSLKIFQNCILAVSISGIDTIIQNDANLRIGYQSDPFPQSQYYHGSMDEVLIYNKALSFDEIKQIFQSNTTSLEENSLVNGIKIFPNPFNEKIQISNQDLTNSTGEIYDVYGRLIKRFYLTSLNHTVLTNNFNRGIYFVIFKGENGIKRKEKMIKY